ncbi:MAG: sugar ABC transporter ATP-binding protein [Bacillota bacterium]|nr:sugar ABC transporter ATP-binding protein [Bacillota bacterium]
MEVVLAMKNISKIYPGTVAIKDINIEICKGEVHGLIGKNGAGKSTLVGIIAGIVTPTTGSISLNGKEYTTLSRIGSKKEKIAIVPQEPQIVLDATVAENLFMPDFPKKNGRINWRGVYAEAERIIKEADLNINAHDRAFDLTVSERQLLLVLKACYVEKAQIIILDEASASLSHTDQENLYRIIRDMKEKGNTILFISHRTDELMDVCDRVTVLRDGLSIMTRNCADIDMEQLSEMIVGESFQFRTYEANTITFDESNVLLSVRNFTRYGAFKDISFDLHKGEILGLAGLRGSGRTEILKGIAGIEPPQLGTVTINGIESRFMSSSQAAKAGIAYLPEDREVEGLVSVLSVKDNLVLNSLDKVAKPYYVSRKKEYAHATGLVQKFEVKTANIEQEVNQLSGGNKQKVVVGRIAAASPKVYLLDEPTRGVDISAKDSILNIIKEKLDPESGVIVTAPGLEDLLLICDRILVLNEGEISKEYYYGKVSEKELFLAVQG